MRQFLEELVVKVMNESQTLLNTNPVELHSLWQASQQALNGEKIKTVKVMLIIEISSSNSTFWDLYYLRYYLYIYNSYQRIIFTHCLFYFGFFNRKCQCSKALIFFSSTIIKTEVIDWRIPGWIRLGCTERTRSAEAVWWITSKSWIHSAVVHKRYMQQRQKHSVSFFS